LKSPSKFNDGSMTYNAGFYQIPKLLLQNPI